MTEHSPSEDNVARRVAWEMKRRGWSQERMAKEVTGAGCPFHQSSISKIVNPAEGLKRRVIAVDEAIAFAKVFGVPFEELLYPLEIALSETARRLVDELEDLERQKARLAREALAVRTQIFALAEEADRDAR